MNAPLRTIQSGHFETMQAAMDYLAGSGVKMEELDRVQTEQGARLFVKGEDRFVAYETNEGVQLPLPVMQILEGFHGALIQVSLKTALENLRKQQSLLARAYQEFTNPEDAKSVLRALGCGLDAVQEKDGVWLLDRAVLNGIQESLK